LATQGDEHGWGCMNPEKDEERKTLGTEVRSKMENESDKSIEDEIRNQWEIKRKGVTVEWSLIFGEIWFHPDDVIINNDPKFQNKIEFYKNTLMEETHKYFKRICYESNKFKNLILCQDEFIITDCVRRCFSLQSSSENDNGILESICNSVEEIRTAIKSNLEKSKAAKRVYYPAVNALMELIYATIGVKRLRSHREKISNITVSISKMEEENSEIKKPN